jgi:hypothetical protein
MSLKGFHIVFITVSTLLFGFLIAWGLLLAEEADAVSRTMMVAGIVGLLLLPVYGVYFLKKAKRIHL